MNLQDALAGGGIVIVLLTLLEIAPIRINPWGALRSIGRKALGCFGSHINSGVLTELQAVRDAQDDMRRKLDSHIESDQRRSANECRAAILHFNNELLRSIRHTKEEYIDILAEIDSYESFCTATRTIQTTGQLWQSIT